MQCQQKKIEKITTKISEIDIKEKIEKINETKNWFFKKTENIDIQLASLKKTHTHTNTHTQTEKGDKINKKRNYK